MGDCTRPFRGNASYNTGGGRKHRSHTSQPSTAASKDMPSPTPRDSFLNGGGKSVDLGLAPWSTLSGVDDEARSRSPPAKRRRMSGGFTPFPASYDPSGQAPVLRPSTSSSIGGKYPQHSKGHQQNFKEAAAKQLASARRALAVLGVQTRPDAVNTQQPQFGSSFTAHRDPSFSNYSLPSDQYSSSIPPHYGQQDPGYPPLRSQDHFDRPLQQLHSGYSYPPFTHPTDAYSANYTAYSYTPAQLTDFSTAPAQLPTDQSSVLTALGFTALSSQPDVALPENDEEDQQVFQPRERPGSKQDLTRDHFKDNHRRETRQVAPQPGDKSSDASDNGQQRNKALVQKRVKKQRNPALGAENAPQATSKLPQCQMSAAELLLFFPNSVLWYPVALRLLGNGFSSREIAAIQLLSREIFDEKELKARKETMRHAVLQAGKKTFNDDNWTVTNSNLPPSNNYDTTAFVPRPGDMTNKQRKDDLLWIISTCKHLPAEEDQGIVTKVLLDVEMLGQGGYTVDDIPMLAARGGHQMPAAANLPGWDQASRIRLLAELEEAGFGV